MRGLRRGREERERIRKSGSECQAWRIRLAVREKMRETLEYYLQRIGIEWNAPGRSTLFYYSGTQTFGV